MEEILGRLSLMSDEIVKSNPDFHANTNKQQCLFTNLNHNFTGFYDHNQLHIESETYSIV